MEVLYRVWKDEGERAGRLAYEQLKALPLSWVEPSEPLHACLVNQQAVKGVRMHQRQLRGFDDMPIQHRQD